MVYDRYGFRKPVYDRYGFLEVVKDKNSFSLNYAGNMGNDEDSVAECVDALYGKGKFKKMKKVGVFAKDKYNTYNDPSYNYVLIIPMAEFLKIVNG
jgi:hypothetical protein